ncbi:MAG: hypothetical protein HY720_16375 [Planctomycetes bacterium]|nr:hypothetical protein [Planctomycetota bacterium]
MKKPIEAIALGLGLWGLGMAALLVLGRAEAGALLAWVATLATVPLLALAARFHLRDVPPGERAHAGLRLGAIVALVQFPLDAAVLGSIEARGVPYLSPPVRGTIVPALILAYAFMIAVPWWVGSRAR